MKQSKVIQFLQSLNSLELNKFEKFVRSPYHNMHKDTLRLFLLLRKAHPDFPDKKIQPERLFKQLFPKKPFQIAKLHTLNKYLSQLFVEYVAWERVQAQEQDHLQRALIEGLAERELQKYLSKPIQEAENAYESYPYRDGAYFYNRMRLSEIEADLIMSQDNRALEVGLHQINAHLDAFYLTQKLRFACAILNRQKFLKEKSGIQLLDEVKAYCSGLKPEEIPVVYLYYQAILMLQEESQEPYYRLSEAMDQYFHLIPREEAISLYSLMINFSNLQYKKGEQCFLKEMFDVYRKMLKHDLLFTSPSAAAIHYKNLVSLALKVKEYAWAEGFLQEYKSELDPETREGVYHYNLANLYFHQEEYRKTIRNLQMVEFSDAFHRLNYQILLLKAFYECEEIEPLFSLCNTFSMYIRRHKSLSEDNRQAHISLATFLRRLSKIREGGKKDLGQLRKEVEESEFLVERKWLLRKVEEMAISD